MNVWCLLILFEPTELEDCGDHNRNDSLILCILEISNTQVGTINWIYSAGGAIVNIRDLEPLSNDKQVHETHQEPKQKESSDDFGNQFEPHFLHNKVWTLADNTKSHVQHTKNEG